MRQERRAHIGVGLFAASALALAACSAPPTAAPADGGAGNEVFAQYEAMPEGERMDALVEAAEEEGTVVAHLRAHEVSSELEAAFEEKYDVDLVILNPGTTQTVQQQLFEQSRAGQMEADVAEVYAHELDLMYAEEGLVAPMPDFIGEQALEPELVSDHAIETFSYPFPVWWNTNAVSEDKAPESFADLADPSWEGRLIMMTNYHPWYITMFQHYTQVEGMSVAEFEDMMIKIAANAETTNSSNPAAQGLASGQYWAAVSGALVSFQRVSGAPMTSEPAVEPVPAVPIGVGLMQEAPHPAAALLFTHWYVTEGMDVMVKEQFIESHPDEAELRGLEIIRPDFSEISTERLTAWRSAYDDLLSGRDSVVPEYVHGG